MVYVVDSAFILYRQYSSRCVYANGRRRCWKQWNAVRKREKKKPRAVVRITHTKSRECIENTFVKGEKKKKKK